MMANNFIYFSKSYIIYMTKLLFSHRAWVQMRDIFPYSESAAIALTQKNPKNHVLKRSIAEMEHFIDEMKRKVEDIPNESSKITATSEATANPHTSNVMKSKRNGITRTEVPEASTRVLRSNGQRAKLRSAKKR